MEAAEDLGVLTECEARQVEEREQVAVADVEEEVVGAGVVAVLEDLGERELEDALIEVDRASYVGADEREVVQAARAARRALRCGPQVAAPDQLALRGDGFQFERHPRLLVTSGRSRPGTAAPAPGHRRWCTARSSTRPSPPPCRDTAAHPQVVAVATTFFRRKWPCQPSPETGRWVTLTTEGRQAIEEAA